MVRHMCHGQWPQASAAHTRDNMAGQTPLSRLLLRHKPIDGENVLSGMQVNKLIRILKNAFRCLTSRYFLQSFFSKFSSVQLNTFFDPEIQRIRGSKINKKSALWTTAQHCGSEMSITLFLAWPMGFLSHRQLEIGFSDDPHISLQASKKREL